MKRENKVTVSLLLIYLVVLTWIILFKMQFSFTNLDRIRSINLIPFAGSVVANGKIDLDEIINNIVVFVPVGLYIEMLKPQLSFLKKLGPVFGLSIFYEMIQFIFAIGGTDITDLIMNTSGGAVGILITILLSKALKENTNKVLNILAALGTFLVLAFLALVIGANY